ncbi:hypothetical protein NC652_020574 [Populus alba x Populus x berolinensis]|nr:hypothetical protein NC652_020574 [Populus alba x Populus x berolinensis]
MTPIASSIHNLSKTDGLMNCGTMQSQQMTCEEALGPSCQLLTHLICSEPKIICKACATRFHPISTSRFI